MLHVIKNNFSCGADSFCLFSPFVWTFIDIRNSIGVLLRIIYSHALEALILSNSMSFDVPTQITVTHNVRHSDSWNILLFNVYIVKCEILLSLAFILIFPKNSKSLIYISNYFLHVLIALVGHIYSKCLLK